LERFVAQGGALVIGARTATKDLDNNVVAATAPGCLRDLAGISVQEYGRQNNPEKRPLRITYGADSAVTELWYEALEVDDADELATWTGRHLTGETAISRRRVGRGAVYYVGTMLTPAVWSLLWPRLQVDARTEPLWPGTPSQVEVVLRTDGDRRIWFFTNRGDEPVRLPHTPVGDGLLDDEEVTGGAVTLERHGVLIVRES